MFLKLGKKVLKKNLIVSLLFFVFTNCLIAKRNDTLRIVSLTPSVTKQLIVLGLSKNIVGCTEYSPLVKMKNLKVAIIGGVSNVNIESVVRLSPSIVFANSLTPKKIIEKLKALNIKVVVFKYPESIEDIFNSFLKLGVLTGKEKKAKEIIDFSKDKLKYIENKAHQFSSKKIFFIIGSHPLYTAPQGTYINDIIEKINGINIARNLKSGLVSREFVLEKNPDVILIMDMGKIAKEEIKYWTKFKNLNAVKNNKIFIIDADRLGSPVLPDFIDLIEEIMKMVHKKSVQSVESGVRSRELFNSEH